MINNHVIFNTLADDILNKKHLIINNKPHRICEIEFYLYSADHKDPFVHKDPDQKKPNKWYFHKRSGTFKGLDITFRPIIVAYNKDIGIYGGILIRSIMKLDDNNIIEGPCNVVDYIFKLCNVSDRKTFIETYGIDIKDNVMLSLQDFELSYQKYYTSPRVGLTLKKSDNLKARKRYIMKDYRYFILPHAYKKNRKLIMCQMIQNNESFDDIIKLTKVKDKELTKLNEQYNKGKNSDLKQFVGINMKVNQLIDLMATCNHRYDIKNNGEQIENEDDIFVKCLQ